ncbi:E3 ubiquitin-protein ligase TRIM35-like isoform X3 [Dicentrarchus labrax]|uniref:E3 ubiquitin-protein ligase TRIM35-like isoform X3 n=1 Tax=Dicentrarchus labrax TaxID=13489 RepID=UPI0021F57255|nr:E3 ubiquitin-protein ligase TRIM35-like isoform X3 [Dicentrarchus labrax]
MATPEHIEQFLVDYLDELDEKQLSTFQWHLGLIRRDGCRLFPKAELEKATREQTVDKLVQVYEEEEAVVTTVDIFSKMKLNNLAKRLTQAHIRRDTKQQLDELVSSTAGETEREGEWTITEDLSCSVCDSIFTDPVTLQCGHNFCRSCVHKHWEKTISRKCPLCQQVTDSESPINFNLKSLCKNYSERGWGEPSGGYRNEFSQAGEQTPSRNVNEKKDAFEKIKQFCDSSIEHIEAQSRDIEKKIKDDFEKLHTFIRTEEETKLAALREEENQKIRMMKLITEMSRSTLSLSDTVKEMEDLRADNSFIQAFKMQMERAQNTLPDPEQLPQVLINESKHVGNLRVWDIILTPVVLDPNTASLALSASECHTWYMAIQSMLLSDEDDKPLHW